MTGAALLAFAASPAHAQSQDRSLSPGTTVLWDFGYGDKHPDLPFQPAAVLLARVISKPGTNRLTLDHGHKSVAPEQPHPRVRYAAGLAERIPARDGCADLVVAAQAAHWFDFDRFHADEILDLIPRYGVTTLCCPPTMYRT